ncbi:hypothetical protein ACWELV_20110 [Streptomyces mirabilis]
MRSGTLCPLPEGADFTAAMAFEIASTNIGITWNYTTWLNIAFLLLAAGLLAPF